MDSHVTEPNKSSYVLQDDAGRKYVVSDNTNGDVVQHSGDKPYPEMTKEHLLRHSTKPFWRTLRLISIILIVLCWIGLIAATIAIIVIHPRCKATPSVTWWQKSVVYRLYLRSFQDSGEDGIGDLKGVTSRLEYLQGLGVGVISLSPFYEYNHAENEFSVLNHTVVDQEYGTLGDFEELVTEAHNLDMRVIVDFIPGTTSTDHTWFTESASSAGRDNPYRNYYVWEGGAQEPTNWLTIYSRAGSRQPAWTSAPGRNQFYLHQFLAGQPALNLRNTRVHQELEDILTFWLDKGVDGFYVRNSAYLFADFDLRDEELLAPTNNPDDYASYRHDYTFALPEINDMFARWRHLVNSYDITEDGVRFLMADIRGSINQTMAYYGRFGRDGVDISLNYDLLPVTDNSCDGTCVKDHLDTWFDNIPSTKWHTWMVGTEDTSRVVSRTNSSLARALTMLTMLLPGTPLTYYGDEIGMTDISHTPANQWAMDQPMRSPMQWSNDTNGGFTNCSSGCATWIPVNPDYMDTNVEDQVKTENEDSDLMFFKLLSNLRQNPSIQYGDFRYVITNENIVSFRRAFDGQSTYLVAMNFGSAAVTQDFRPSEDVTEGTVEAVTDPTDALKVSKEVDLSSIQLDPHGGVVISWDYQIKQY